MSIAIRKILDDNALLEKVTKRAFDVIDTDKSGKIEKGELKKILEQISSDFMAEPPNEDEIKKIMGNYDEDNSGTIELNEFQKFIRDILEAMINEKENKIIENN